MTGNKQSLLKDVAIWLIANPNTVPKMRGILSTKYSLALLSQKFNMIGKKIRFDYCMYNNMKKYNLRIKMNGTKEENKNKNMDFYIFYDFNKCYTKI